MLQALGSVNMADTAKQEQTDKDAYVVNPPLIHCLDMTSDGLIAAAGLENGKVRVHLIYIIIKSCSINQWLVFYHLSTSAKSKGLNNQTLRATQKGDTNSS